ncbi:reverse transcriptase domain-containing protein [Tanacetum coccineum]
MANQRTMAELLRVPTEGYAEAIVVAPILAEHFELKRSLINMMTSDQFFGLEKDNPHDHICWFNKITSIIKYKDVPNSAIKLMHFPFSLAGQPVVGNGYPTKVGFADECQCCEERWGGCWGRGEIECCLDLVGAEAGEGLCVGAGGKCGVVGMLKFGVCAGVVGAGCRWASGREGMNVGLGLSWGGYFQIPIDPQDQKITTFICPYGTFAYCRMPFGLCNALGTFQRCMMAIFHDMIEKTMEVFMDDFSVFRDRFDSCLSNLEKC